MPSHTRYSAGPCAREPSSSSTRERARCLKTGVGSPSTGSTAVSKGAPGAVRRASISASVDIPDSRWLSAAP